VNPALAHARVLRVLGALAAVAAVWLCPEPAAARDWPVPSAVATITAALERARDGDRIVIASGTYRERIVVERRVTLVGAEGGAPPVIDGGGEGRVIELRAPGSAVERLQIQNSGDVVEHSDACVFVATSAEGASVRGNMLRDCAFGIWVHGTERVTLEGNWISGRIKKFDSDKGNGINLWQVSRGLVRGNAIERVRDGIALSVTTGSRLEFNRMRDLRFGIHYMYSDRNTVQNNVTCDSIVGMALMYSRRLDIRGNVMLRNRDQGVMLRSILDSSITANRAEGNGKGLMLNETAFSTVQGNWIARNDVGVHVTGGNEDVGVTGNAFVRNVTQIVYGMTQPVLWDDGEQGNHWSDYLGWDLDRDGRGDRPHQATGTMDRLLFRFPGLKVLAASPVMLMMQWVEAKFPVVRPASVIDRHPTMRPTPLPDPMVELAPALADATRGTPADQPGFCLRATDPVAARMRRTP